MKRTRMKTLGVAVVAMLAVWLVWTAPPPASGPTVGEVRAVRFGPNYCEPLPVNSVMVGDDLVYRADPANEPSGVIRVEMVVGNQKVRVYLRDPGAPRAT
jgi:hypothetical protein